MIKFIRESFHPRNKIINSLEIHQLLNDLFLKKLDIDNFKIKDVSSKKNILDKLSIKTTEKIIDHDVFNNTLGLYHNDNTLALLGDVKNQYLSRLDIKNKVYYASLDIDNILKLISVDFIKYNKLSKFPNVKRELNFLFENKVQYKPVENYILNQSNIKNLHEMTLSDVYEDQKLPEGKKSYTLNFTLQDQIKTLSEKEISLTMNKIQSKIESKFNAVLRS